MQYALGELEALMGTDSQQVLCQSGMEGAGRGACGENALHVHEKHSRVLCG